MELFNTLVDQGEAGIERLIAERTPEGLELDFKEKGDRSNGRFSEDDKRVFAKALSAFSNSAGGVLIYGVKAKKVDGVDCAQAPGQPIDEIEKFRSEAVTLVGQLLQPKHDAIDVRAVSCAAAPGSGYLIVNVPRSERRPHRSEAKDQKQYFKRSGDSSFPMEHYDIEDAFKRLSEPMLSPRLVLRATPELPRTAITRFFLIDAELSLYNESGISARFPYISVKTGSSGAEYAKNNSVFLSHVNGETVFEAKADAVINPGNTKLIAVLTFEFRTDHDGSKPSIKQWVLKKDLTINFGCLDTRRRSQTIAISAEEIENLIERYVEVWPM